MSSSLYFGALIEQVGKIHILQGPDKFWLLKVSQFSFDDQKMRLFRISRNSRCYRDKELDP